MLGAPGLVSEHLLQGKHGGPVLVENDAIHDRNHKNSVPPSGGRVLGVGLDVPERERASGRDAFGMLVGANFGHIGRITVMIMPADNGEVGIGGDALRSGLSAIRAPGAIHCVVNKADASYEYELSVGRNAKAPFRNGVNKIDRYGTAEVGIEFLIPFGAVLMVSFRHDVDLWRKTLHPLFVKPDSVAYSVNILGEVWR